MIVQKNQAIIIGLGETGVRVVNQYLRDYGCPRRTDAGCDVPEHVALIRHRENRPGCGPVVPGVFDSHDEEGLIDGIAQAFEHMLGERPVRDFGFSYTLDVFVVGAWRDQEYGFHLPLVLPFVERLGHERYASIFNPRDDIRNIRLLVHPLALSINMPREPERKALTRLLANVAHWSEKTRREGRGVVPRFFIYDGFTNNIHLTWEEVVDISANFLGLCTRSGARNQEEFRRLLAFAPYDENFFCALSLATIRFDRNGYREATIDVILRQLDEMLLEKPTTRYGGRQAPEDPVEQLTEVLDAAVTRSDLMLRTAGTDFYRRLILDAIMTYESRPTSDRPALEDRLVELHAQGRTFPSGAHHYPPETLSRFFDRRWLGHLFESCHPEGSAGVAGGFGDVAQSVRRAWFEELESANDKLRSAMLDLLGPGRANFSLPGFSAMLGRFRREVVPATRDRIASESEDLPSRRWRFTTVRDIWGRFRSQIWNYIPAHAIAWWIPFFGILSSLFVVAAFRFLLTRIDPATEGARMLQRLDAGPFLLPGAMGLMLLLCIPLAALLGIVRRKRLDRYLDTDPAPEGGYAPFDADGPEMVAPGDFRGVLPSAADLMARKTGSWWHLHEKLGIVSLVLAVLRVLDAKVGALHREVDRAMSVVEERCRRREAPGKEIRPGGLYFHDELLQGLGPEEFADRVVSSLSVKIAAQSIGGRLYQKGPREFLAAIADEAVLREEVLQEIPFFEGGCVFALPSCEKEALAAVRSFVGVLHDRLSHGQVFHFLGAEEEDKLIEQTEIYLVAPRATQGLLDAAARGGLTKFHRLVGADADHIWGLKIVRDISTPSLIRYMNPDITRERAMALMDRWSGATRGAEATTDPWSEYRTRS